MHLGERAHFDRIVGDESRLYEGAFAEFAEDFVNQFALAHGIVDLHLQLTADLTDFVFTLAFEVISSLFLDGFEDRQTAVRSFEADGLTVNLCFGATVYSNTDALQ